MSEAQAKIMQTMAMFTYNVLDRTDLAQQSINVLID